jgi:hypothetical protein
MSIQSDDFVRKWVADNVHPVTGLTDLRAEVVRLAAKLFVDAAAVGIRGAELANTVGDVREFLANAYENAHDRGAARFH